MSTLRVIYKMQGTNYVKPGNITTTGAVAIMFLNQGTSAVTIQPLNVVLQQQQQLLIPGNIGEQDGTQYSVVFDNTDPNQNVNVVTKVYG